MLLNLIFSYFFKNRERTFKATLLLLLNSTILFSTAFMVEGLNVELELLTRRDLDGQYPVIISHKNGEILEEEIIHFIEELLQDKSSVRYHFPKFSKLITLKIEGISKLVELQITDVETYDKLNWITISSTNYTNGLYIPSELYSNSTPVIGEELEVTIFDTLLSIPVVELYNSQNSLGQVFLLDSNYYSEIGTLNFTFNSYEVGFYDFRSANLLLEELLNKYPQLEVNSKLSGNIFLLKSTRQITRILEVLQLSMALLQFLAISYIMFILTYESKDEIKILKSIGYNRYKISFLFVGQAALVGILSVLLAIFLSVFFVAFIVSLITGVLESIFIVPQISLNIIILNLIQNVFVSVIAAVYPAWRFVK